MTADPKNTLLNDVFALSKKLGKIPFPLAVKVSSGFDVIPINPNNEYDKKLIEIIRNTLTKFLETTRASQPVYKGRRINDVGRKIEPQIVHELNKLPLQVKLLGKTGYPDIEISFQDHITYLEMKTSSVTDKSSLRYFYYTGGTKINANAHHLLLSILTTSDSSGYWKIENLALSDLSTLNVRLKAELNASKSDLMDSKAQLFIVK
jgi:hypothetical protein